MQSGKTFAPGWVHSLADYRQMFDLSDEDLKKKIVVYPGGLSSFNAQMHALGHNVVSGDCHYGLTVDAMQQALSPLPALNEQYLRSHAGMLQDEQGHNIQAILALWQDTVDQFVQDYALGKKENRYQIMQLPNLPFAEGEFELALCPDLLFDRQVRDTQSPQQLVAELLRVAEEVRVFPLLNEQGEISKELGPVMVELQQHNFGLEVRAVPFEQLKGGNAMLRIWALECVLE